MNAIERNLVFNSLVRIQRENEVLPRTIDNPAVEFSLEDATSVMRLQLGTEAVSLYGFDDTFEPRSLEGYRDELLVLCEFIRNAISGRDPKPVAYDALVLNILERCVIEIDSMLAGSGDGGGDGDSGDSGGDGDAGDSGDGDGGGACG